MGCHYGHHAYLGDPTKPELSDLVLWGCLLWQWLKTAEADGLKKSEFKVRVFPNLRRIWGSQSWETRTGWKRAKLWGVKKSIAAWWFTDLFFSLSETIPKSGTIWYDLPQRRGLNLEMTGCCAPSSAGTLRRIPLQMLQGGLGHHGRTCPVDNMAGPCCASSKIWDQSSNVWTWQYNIDSHIL